MAKPTTPDNLGNPRWAIGYFWLSFLLCVSGWLFVIYLIPNWPDAIPIALLYALLYIVFPIAWVYCIYLVIKIGNISNTPITFNIVTIFPFLIFELLGFKQVKARYLVNAGIILLILGILPIGFMWLLGFMEGLPFVCFTNPGYCFW